MTLRTPSMTAGVHEQEPISLEVDRSIRRAAAQNAPALAGNCNAVERTFDSGNQVRTMRSMMRISGRLIAAARALVGVSQADFAGACGLPVETLRRWEAGGSAWVSSDADVDAVMRGMSHFGVVIVEETDDMGAGVRLKFTRADVRQIARLEGEGGIVGSDDAP
jgi:DNA-binding transcriptional regulator YiaG